MDAQLIVVLLFIAAAGWYLLRVTWKAWKKGQTMCGCPGTPTQGQDGEDVFIPLKDLKLRKHDPN